MGRGAAGQWQWEDDEFQFLAQLDGGCLKVGNDKIATLLHAHLTECECVRAPACVCVCASQDSGLPVEKASGEMGPRSGNLL